jgi:hypothetical protein
MQLSRRTLYLVSALCVASGLRGQAIDTTTAPKANRPLLAMIARFLANPDHETRLGRAITDSAIKRPDVTLSIGTDVVPWLTKDYSQPVKGLLLAGFSAGNMAVQLQSGKKGDQPLAGIESTLAVYARLQEVDGALSVPELDAWQAMKEAGTLAAHVDSLVAARKKAP